MAKTLRTQEPWPPEGVIGGLGVSYTRGLILEVKENLSHRNPSSQMGGTVDQLERGLQHQPLAPPLSSCVIIPVSSPL